MDLDKFESDRQNIFLPRWDKLEQYVDPEQLFLVGLKLKASTLVDLQLPLNLEIIENMDKSLRDSLFDAIPSLCDGGEARRVVFETYKLIGEKILDPINNIETPVKEGLVIAYAGVMSLLLEYQYLHAEVEDAHNQALCGVKYGLEINENFDNFNPNMQAAYEIVCDLYKASEDGEPKDIEKIFQEIQSAEMNQILVGSKKLIPFGERTGSPYN
ncbi:MAG: hypothetical protein GOV00_01165 [Candidatus Altiarchaeota archaeon]|nr:hypothetical protein [Candidatus Altiarchaeota archaeon]